MIRLCTPNEDRIKEAGWHELRFPYNPLTGSPGSPLFALWQPQPDRSCRGRWRCFREWVDADTAAGMDGWTYVGPATGYAEVEALRQEVKMLLETMQRIGAKDFDCSPNLMQARLECAAQAAVTTVKVTRAARQAKK